MQISITTQFAFCVVQFSFAECYNDYITIGLVGMALVLVAYPLYQYISEKKRGKVAPEILRLTEELMNEGK